MTNVRTDTAVLTEAADALWDLAESATPGPWRLGQHAGEYAVLTDDTETWVAHCGPGDDGRKDALLLSRLNPAVLTNLVALLRSHAARDHEDDCRTYYFGLPADRNPDCNCGLSFAVSLAKALLPRCADEIAVEGTSHFCELALGHDGWHQRRDHRWQYPSGE